MTSMTMVNVNNLLNQKDSRWLQLEVCREYQRNKCSRADSECKFAHPPTNVEVQSGRVTACYDSIKGRCTRENPPCKYFHPPQHLKDQLLINGRNHLALKNAILQQLQGIIPPGNAAIAAAQMPQISASSPYIFNHLSNPYSIGVSPLVPQSVVPMEAAGLTTAFPGIVPFKRQAGDKSGLPVFQPNAAAATAAAYQQLVSLHQQFVPVTCEYSKACSSSSIAPSSCAGADSCSADSDGAPVAPLTCSARDSELESGCAAYNSETPSGVSSPKPISSPSLYTGVSLNKQIPYLRPGIPASYWANLSMASPMPTFLPTSAIPMSFAAPGYFSPSPRFLNCVPSYPALPFLLPFGNLSTAKKL